MPAPPELKNKVVRDLAAAIGPLVDQVWDEAVRATMKDAAAKVQQLFVPSGLAVAAVNVFQQPAEALPRKASNIENLNTIMVHAADAVDRIVQASLSPQKRGAQNRAPKGQIKGTIKDLIETNSDTGLTVAQIRDLAQLVKGVTIKEGSMKQGLRLLQKDKAIERRGLLYFPTKNGGQSND